VLLIVIPQHLGDEQFGQYSFAGTFVAFFGLFAGLSGGTFIVKQTARNQALVGPYVFNALLMTLPLTGLLSAAAIGAAYVLGYPSRICLIVAIACIGMVLASVNSTLVAGLQGQQRMRRTAMWAIVDRYVVGVALVAVLFAGKGLLGVALVASMTGLISIFGNGAQLFRQVRAGAHLDIRLWKVLAVGASPFMVWAIVLAVYGSIDIFMLSKMTDDAVVGWYALAYRLAGMPIFLASIVVTVIFPRLSSFGTGPSSASSELVNQAVRRIFFASAPMTAGLAMVAGDLISFLHYSGGFTHSVILIEILALHIPVVGITMILYAALMASDRQRQWIVVGIIAAVFNPLLNLIAIPLTAHAYGNGAIGAAMITVATEFLMLSGGFYLLRRDGVPDRGTIKFVLRCVVSCAVLVGVVEAGEGLWLPARIALGVVTYGLASLAVGTLSATELRSGFVRTRAFLRLYSVPGIPQS
jgi:O-antigen/teichoic acid export membrane protein